MKAAPFGKSFLIICGIYDWITSISAWTKESKEKTRSKWPLGASARDNPSLTANSACLMPPKVWRHVVMHCADRSIPKYCLQAGRRNLVHLPKPGAISRIRPAGKKRWRRGSKDPNHCASLPPQVSLHSSPPVFQSYPPFQKSRFHAVSGTLPSPWCGIHAWPNLC